MYFTASEADIGAKRKLKQTSEIHKIYFNVFYSE